MPPPRRADRKRNPSKSQPQQRQQQQQKTRQAKQTTTKKTIEQTEDNGAETPAGLDLSTTIPISLQQLLLDVFKTALLSPSSTSTESPTETSTEGPTETNTAATSDPNTLHTLDTKSLIQTIKSHLYQRDFDSAFTDAGENLLRAYALRWSAARALGYAGLLRGVLRYMHCCTEEGRRIAERTFLGREVHTLQKWGDSTHVVCIGGGAGAEIVALAAVWRDLGIGFRIGVLEDDVAGISLLEKEAEEEKDGGSDAENNTSSSRASPSLSITAVDIADWSSVIDRLSQTISAATVPTPSTSKHQPPLVPAATPDATPGSFSVEFRRADVLSLSETELQDILLNVHTHPQTNTNTNTSASQSTSTLITPVSLLVTLMFTLNELFTTSIPKATSLLLNITDTLPAGAVLLVVDSPGSYSTLKLGKTPDDGSAQQERKYPMKFLLDHTLLSVAQGKWERLYTQGSRWWRRDANRLRYEVGEGAGLEDMRFQVHLYRRI